MRRSYIWLFAFALACSCWSMRAMDAGAARVDITPDYPVRLTGYGNRKTNSTGVSQHIWAKALVLGRASNATVVVTVDNLGLSAAITDEVSGRLKKSFGIPRERISYCFTHTHSAPMVSGVAPNIFSTDLTAQEQATAERYTRELIDKLERVVVDAFADLKPARVRWAEGTVAFAKNRRVRRAGVVQIADNDAGPVDHSLPALLVTDMDGKLRAVWTSYACHCTTLGGDLNQVHGDWAGCAQADIEQRNPGAVALVSLGCAGDSNPSPRGSITNALAHGRELAMEIQRLAAMPGIELSSPPICRLERFALDFDPLPTQAQWQERAKQTNIVGYHARKNLARLAKGETIPTTLPYIVQTWVFQTNLAMVFLAGEVVIDYELRLKRDFDRARLWVNGYANDVPCYIPSARILREGGYEAETSLWYYDRPARLSTNNEDRIIAAVHQQLPSAFVAANTNSEMTRPLSPKEALNSIRLPTGFKADLVAAEPLVVDPVAIDWGIDGRMWVAEMYDYPMGIDGNWKPGGRIKFLQDTNHDGIYDTATLFLEGIPFPTGVFAWRKGVLICAAPDITYAEDTDGDGRADLVRKVFGGFETNNYQARVNSLSLGLDNWIYGANGLLGGTIHGMSGTNEVNIRGRDFRMQPDSGLFEPVSGLTQQGRVRDDFGNWFGCDNSHLIWHFPFADEYVRRNPYVTTPNPAVAPSRGADWNRLYPVSRTLERFNDPKSANRVTSACGLEIYRDELLGRELYGNAFTCEPVHNLVHREVLEQDGVTFTSHRATNELTSEFFASTDNWCRPVQVRTGPDGALWVVDMYRFVIEHPRWIPSNRLAQLDVRAGSDRGRIYRVFREGAPPRAIRDFSKSTTAELASALDSASGTERDRIHRELLNGNDNAAVAPIRELARKSERPAVRLQAVSLLRAFEALPAGTLTALWRAERDPRVRAQLLAFASGSSGVDQMVIDGVRDPDIHVRYQAASAAYAIEKPADALKLLIDEAATNAWIRAAVLSSATRCAPELLAASIGQAAVAAPLLKTIVGGGNADQVRAALDLVTRDLSEISGPEPLASAAALMEAAPNVVQDGSPSVARAKAVARTIVERDGPVPRRAAALRLLAMAPDDADFGIVGKLLTPNPMQAAAISALTRASSDKAAELLLAHWLDLTPSQRAAALTSLASRASSVDRLLTAAEQGIVAPGEISIELRSRLLTHGSDAVRNRAERLWPKRQSDRAALVAEYRKAMGTHGDARNGAAVFDRVCANCHSLRGHGHAVGPDLAPLRDKSVDDFLIAILDPNAVVEPRFINYNVETRDGRSLSGVIRSETASGFVLVQGGGVEQPLLRSEVAETRASSLSLMPEGLEAGISPAEMNDLIAWIKKPQPRLFGSVTPAEAEAARKQFRSGPGAAAVVSALASERLDYPGWLGQLPLLHCRQTDGKSHVTWSSVAGQPATNGCVQFAVPAAMGHLSQPAGSFTLRVNGREAVGFNVSTDDAAWQSADGTVRLAYEVIDANAEDSSGVLAINVSTNVAKPGSKVNFEVAGSQSSSMRWFGIYQLTADEKATGAGALSASRDR